MYTCPNCLNTDRKYFAFRNNVLYCRKCLSFYGDKVEEKSNNLSLVTLNLNYSLSSLQEEISNNVINAYMNHKNVLINAVCGAGKTELVYGVIKYALEKRQNVGFAVPRRDVVIDLLPRFKSAFPLQKVISVYGGHHDELNGDIIILTTHQLFRYENYFDLLILDEIDAFPYQGNEVLNNFFKKSVKGNYILMSATARENLISEIKNNGDEVFYLDKRYHNHPLPVPTIKSILFGKIFYLFYKIISFQKKKLPLLVFVPTIEECENLYSRCRFIKNGNFVHSKREQRNEIIEDFKKEKYDYLITTSVLERGVTIKNLQVIIYNAHHALYDEKSLIQIAGRVGRKIDAYSGEVIFIADYITEEMQRAVSEIERANRS